MKRVLAFAAFAAILAGCAKEIDNQIVESTNTEEVSKVAKVVLHASIPEVDTKVSTDNAGAYKWQAGDVVTVLNTSGTPYEFDAEEGGTAVDFASTTFDGTLSTEAFYPASTNHVSGKFYLESSINWSQDVSMMPMLGNVNPGALTASFQSAGGVLKLICYNVPDDARKLVVTSATKQITGLFTPTGDPKVITSSDKSESNNILTINFLAGHSASMVFYIPMPTSDVGILTFTFKDGSDVALFEQTTKDVVTMSRNKMIVAPALNCSPVLWREDWSGFSKDDKPSDGSGSGYGSVSVTYTEVSDQTTTKIYDEKLADGTKPELLVSRKGSGAGGNFKAAGIPTDGASSMILTFKSNNTLSVTASSGITVGSVGTGSGSKTVILTNAGSVSTFDLTFSNTATGSNARLDDIKVVKNYSSPTITSAASVLSIGVGYLSNTLTVNLTGGVDDLGISPILSGADYSWVESVSISGTTLTATAKNANTGASEREATITLKATGAASKVITLKQPTALVTKPASISAVPASSSFTASWTGETHATGYKAYLCASSGLADPTGGTELDITDNGDGTWSVTKNSLTNGTTYYLYVKVDSVDANYVAEDGYTEVSVTPDFHIYYEKVTSAPADWSGEYLFVWGTNAHYAVTGNGLATTAAVEISDNKIVSTGHNSHKITIEKVSTNYYIKLPSGNYVTNASDSNTCTETASQDQAYTFAVSDGCVLITGAGSKILQKNGNYYRFYNSNDSYPKPMLFKLNDPRTDPTLIWKKGGVAADADGATMLTGDDTMPTIALTNTYSLPITYSSSNTGVATIDPSTGVMTLVSAGETIITAAYTVENNETYKPGSASYTLSVTDNRTVPVITLDTSNAEYTTDNYGSFTGRSASVSPSVTLVYSKTDASGIIDDFSSSTGALTLSGNTGSATVTVSFGGTTEYKPAVSQSYIINVTSASGPVVLNHPDSPSITAISPTSFTASWTAAANALGYSWKISTSSNPEAAAITNGTGSINSGATTTVTVSSGISLSAGTTYYFHIKSVGDGGVSYSDSDYNSTSKVFYSVTYTVTSTTAVSTSGTAPTGSTASFNNTYTGNKVQITKTNSQTLTLDGFDGKTIVGITLSMHSNAAQGAGTFSAVAGTTTLASISSKTGFNSWYDNTSYGTDWRDVHVAMTSSSYVIDDDEDVVIVIACVDTNSLYCQSFTVFYY